MNSIKKQEYKKPEVTELSSSVTNGQTGGMGAKSGATMEEGNSGMGVS